VGDLDEALERFHLGDVEYAGGRPTMGRLPPRCIPCSGGFRGEPDEEVDRVSGNWDEIRDHAACWLREHAIKRTEAYWREDRIREDSAFRAALADAALKIDMRGRRAES